MFSSSFMKKFCFFFFFFVYISYKATRISYASQWRKYPIENGEVISDRWNNGWEEYDQEGAYIGELNFGDCGI